MTLLLALLLVARADVIFPPPPTCPDGAEPASGHNCDYCAPVTCSARSPCERGRCERVEACVERVRCHHRGGSSWHGSLLGRADVQGACAQGRRQPMNLCVSAHDTPAPGRGCHRTGARAALGAWPLGLLLLRRGRR